MPLINAKLKYYKKVFDLDEFKKAIENREGIWKQEMEQLVPTPVSFKEVKKQLVFIMYNIFILNKRTFCKHEIKVIAYGEDGPTDIDTVEVFIFNLNIF